MSTTEPTTGPHLSIELPEPWEPLPLEPDSYDAWLADKLETADLPADEARQIAVAFRSVLVEARAEGLVFAAGFIAGIEDPGGGVELLAASAFGAVRPAGDLAGMLSTTTWLAALTDADRTGDLALLRPAEVVMVGDREAVRAVTLDELPADSVGPAVPLFGVTYHFTIADGDAILVLGFRTPCVWLSGEFEGLFETMAATLVIDV